MQRLYCLLALLAIAPCSAALVPDTTALQLAALGQSPNWTQQLYLQDAASTAAAPRINDPEFYFSTGPRIDPIEEIRTNYQAIFSNLDAVDNGHPLCQFPSRFLYLNKALALNVDQTVLDRCAAFNEWARLDRYDRLIERPAVLLNESRIKI
jgi:hypothetical protein